ncbi:MAG TPA: hypothetical protein VE817_00070, partial [Candidatus Acidoferrum sp.]|nr:hypothetical protein [Candidatus Acidoferrum sp.]
MGHRARSAQIAVAVATLAGAGAAIAASVPSGRIGPQDKIQPNGRKLHPAGKLTRLGNAPAGGGLTRNGRFLWTLSAGRGANDIRIVAVSGPRRGKVVQRVLMPGLSGGIAMDPRRNVAYVSGLADSTHADEQVPASIPGRRGDVIQVLRYNGRTGKVSRNGTIPVLPPP